MGRIRCAGEIRWWLVLPGFLQVPEAEDPDDKKAQQAKRAGDTEFVRGNHQEAADRCVLGLLQMINLATGKSCAVMEQASHHAAFHVAC
jgi:hypothetical protein